MHRLEVAMQLFQFRRLAPFAFSLAALGGAHVTSPSAAHAAGSGTLPVDCTAWDSKDVKCSGDVGTVGSGPKFTGGLTTSVNHGFISGNELIVAVELQGSDDEYGGIFSIDLTSGKRTLRSGKLKDPVEGDQTKGAGKSLNMVKDVALAPNGSWIALANTGLVSSRTIFSIDPATGNRKVIFDDALVPCAGASGKVAFDPSSGLTVGSDNAIYLVLNNMPQSSGKGIAKLTLDGKCSVVTLSGGPKNIGTGPDVIGSFLYNVTFKGDSLYLLQFNTHPSVLSIDPKTGNRKMVSVSPDKGTGPDARGDSMAVAADGTIWTYHGYRSGSTDLVSIDPTTGNRTAYTPKRGPVGRIQGADRGIWVHPNGKNILLQYGNAILIFDPATGNSNTLSH
jgi:hypothetical protein